ncbi:hypothetical protein TIFTF001_024363 [Ficus carica]|uniref:Uncharacterized protein n=1 Tax=Ficus carica TaxID=3494 RepID=A0AA88DEN0_FICCA|nr:hypothetical protein TIFTF001_024363 [Ficus carica]
MPGTTQERERGRDGGGGREGGRERETAGRDAGYNPSERIGGRESEREAKKPKIMAKSLELMVKSPELMVKTTELIASWTVGMMRAGHYVSRRSNSFSPVTLSRVVFQPMYAAFLSLSPPHHCPPFCIQGLG